MGFISQSALKLRPEFAAFDAELRYEVPGVRVADPKACQCGEVLKGVIKPWECKVFGTACTPETPIGTCMVSSEGACAAYYNFGRMHREAAVTLGRRRDQQCMTLPSVADRDRPVVRRRIRVVGVVQGVGFRPFVHRLATELALAGHVGNDTEGVLVEVEGQASAVDRFEHRLVAEAPAAGPDRRRRDESTVAPCGEAGFRIVESRGRRRGRGRGPSSPPTSPCATTAWPSCSIRTDRRYRYPFINCTNCGPRFTITVRLPYDRPNTTMAGFALCRECRSQYDDPADRRFHAQPVACPACGPQHLVRSSRGRHRRHRRGDRGRATDARRRARSSPIKGLGGYHLACDARSPRR